MRHYVLRGGAEGKSRLSVLARVLAPTTSALFDRCVAPGMACLDVGCSGGDVTLELARRVGPTGRVVGIDLDDAILALARQSAQQAGLSSVDFRHGNALELAGEGTFDLAYARFLLTHLSDPVHALSRLRTAVRGGTVLVEDVDFAGHFCHPPCPAFARYVELYRAVVRARGGDADVGPRLPGLFTQAGLEVVDVRLVQPVGLRGEVKLIAGLTLDRVRDAVLADGLATAQELRELLCQLDAYARDPHTLMSLPRIFQVQGKGA